MNKLECACRDQDLEEIRKLLESGVSPNTENVVYWALWRENIRLVKIFLEYWSTPILNIAMYWASSRGYTGVVGELLEHGVDVNSEDTLWPAAYTRRIDTVKLLLEKGSDPFRDGIYRKVETLRFIIKNNLMSLEDIEKNKDRIPPEVWEKLYE